MASKRRLRRLATTGMPDAGESCTGKALYATAREAMRAALELSMRESFFIRAYQCRHCGGFHIGHAPRALLELASVRQERRRQATARRWERHLGRLEAGSVA